MVQKISSHTLLVMWLIIHAGICLDGKPPSNHDVIAHARWCMNTVALGIEYRAVMGITNQIAMTFGST